MHRKVAAALVAALALLVASCGGSETLTRAELVDRIEAACRQAARETNQEGRGPDSFLLGVLAGQRLLVERVEAIEPPDELSEDVDTLKAGLAERTDVVASLAEASRSERDRAMAAAEAKMEASTRDVEGALRRLGVSGCS